MPQPPDLHDRMTRLEEEVAELRALVESLARSTSGRLGYTLSGVAIGLGFVVLILVFTG